VDGGFDAKLLAPGPQPEPVEHFDIRPTGGGWSRSRAAALRRIRPYAAGHVRHLRPTAALTNWYTDAYKPACMKGFDT